MQARVVFNYEFNLITVDMTTPATGFSTSWRCCSEHMFPECVCDFQPDKCLEAECDYLLTECFNPCSDTAFSYFSIYSQKHGFT